jgi:membrane fusion protein (multidrug efflux system)
MAVRSAEGRLDVAQARLRAATPQRQRVARLFERGTVNARDLEHAEQEYAQARAEVAAASAELERARLDLAYTDVRAPISGYTGRAVQSEGSLVRSDDDTSLLTTMAQSRRLYVNFTVPLVEAQLLRTALAQPSSQVVVAIVGAGGGAGSIAGQIEFIDTRVRSDTGTVAVRAIVENGAELLAPGQFVRVNLSGLYSEPAIFIPERAVLNGAGGPFVWKLDEGGSVTMQPLALGEGHQGLVAATSGLAEGDRIVVDGILKVAPGAPVQAVAQELSVR